MIRQLFFWYDRFRADNYDATLIDFVSKIGDDELLEVLKDTSLSLYGSDGAIKKEINQTKAKIESQ